MNTATTFYIIRHGQSDGNIQKIVQGQSDSHLTEEGKRQALQLGSDLRDVNFDVAFSSDSVRAKETAEIVAVEKRLAVHENELLREHSMGQWEGQDEEVYHATYVELFEKYEKLSEEEKWQSKIPDDVESDEEVKARFLKFASETANRYPGKTVLVVTHGGVIRCLLVHLSWGKHKELPVGVVGNTACVRVKTDGTNFVIEDVKGVTKRSSENIST